jgi:hypothetical protein
LWVKGLPPAPLKKHSSGSLPPDSAAPSGHRIRQGRLAVESSMIW